MISRNEAKGAVQPNATKVRHIYAIFVVALTRCRIDKDHAMPFSLSNAEALGRTYAAARMMAGLDQAALSQAAGVSAATISNVERGRDARPETIKAVRRALAREGVLVAFSRNNGLASVTISFSADDGEDE